jgi:hypothetical protein
MKTTKRLRPRRHSLRPLTEAEARKEIRGMLRPRYALEVYYRIAPARIGCPTKKARAGKKISKRARRSVASKKLIQDLITTMRGFDRQIERLVKKSSDGSGCWLRAGLRDIYFDFPSKTKALAAASRIEKANLTGVRVMLRSFEKP